MLAIILTSILIALVFAPLGCVALWKRYIYFGDGLAHASILAGSVSVILNLPLIYAGIITAIIFAGLIFKFKDASGTNATVNLISSLMLSIALILSIANPTRINISQLLFGDIISTSGADLVSLSAILVLVYVFIGVFYNQILLIVLDRDIALVKKIKVNFIELLFLVLLSITVFSSIKIVGSLLVTSILIIPAMSARLIAGTPFKMIIISTLIALGANLLGLYASFHLDVPVAPIIIVIQCIIYFICYIFIIRRII